MEGQQQQEHAGSVVISGETGYQMTDAEKQALVKEDGNISADLKAAASKREDIILNSGEAYCSWCFESGQFQQVVKEGWIARAVFECKTCSNNVVVCYGCSTGLARSYPDAADRLCYICKGIGEWDKGRPPAVRGRCSWCFQSSFHALYRKHTVGRDEYICTKVDCGSPTLKCRLCGDAFARKHATWADELCAVCDKTIPAWEGHTVESVNLAAWCSWCCTKATQVMTQKRVTTRVYRCEACKQSGVVCKTCGVGMCKTGMLWDDSKCLACQSQGKDAELFSWETIKERRDVLFAQGENRDRLVAELMRDSKWRTLAQKAGMERLFLLLVSMPGFSRNQLASFLGFSLLIHPSFGDPHQESWAIINSTGRGFQSRSTEAYERINPLARSCNWMEVLIRTGKTVQHEFEKHGSYSSKQAQAICLNDDKEVQREMEEDFLQHMITVAEKHRDLMIKQARLWTEDQGESMELEAELKKNESVEGDAAIREKIMKHGGFSRPDVLRYGVSLVKFASGAPGPISLGLMAANWLVAFSGMSALAPMVGAASASFAMLATPLFFFGLASLGYTGFNMLLGSSHGRLLEPILMVISQRFILAAKGLNVQQFLKKPE